MKLWNFVKQNMLRYPKQTVSENEAQMSFEELVIFAELFASRLQGLHCCAILCRSEMAAAMALLSCFAAEVTAVPLSMRYGEQHCRKILDTIQPDAIITDDSGELTVTFFSGQSISLTRGTSSADYVYVRHHRETEGCHAGRSRYYFQRIGCGGLFSAGRKR